MHEELDDTFQLERRGLCFVPLMRPFGKRGGGVILSITHVDFLGSRNDGMACFTFLPDIFRGTFITNPGDGQIPQSCVTLGN